jgi:hypothetical protein
MTQTKTSGNNIKKYPIRWDIWLLLSLSILVFGGMLFLFRDRWWSQVTGLLPLLRHGSGVAVILGSGSDKGYFKPVKGGQLKLTDRNGYTQELAVKPGSLLTAEEFSIESIDEIKGLSNQVKFISGIHISADPLLREPAEIKFDIPSGIQTDQLAGFAYSKDGKDWHLYPVKIINNQIIMYVDHFSGYGLITVGGSLNQMSEPDSIRAQAEQNLARIIQSEAQNQLLGESEDMSDETYRRIENILRVWYKTAVSKYLDQAQNNEDLLLFAAKEYLSWYGQVQRLNVEEFFSREIGQARALFSKAITNTVDKLYTRCQKEKDITQASRLMQLAALIQLFESEVNQDINSQDIIEKAKQCLGFKLRIQTTITRPPEINRCTQPKEIYEGEINFDLNQEDMTVTGEGEVTGRLQVCSVPCTYNKGSLKQIVKIPATKVMLSEGESQIEITMELPELEDGPALYNCGLEDFDTGNDIITEEDLLNYSLDWAYEILANHNNENSNWQAVKITDWEIVNKDGVFARKSYDINSITGDGREQTVFEIIHSPGK